MRIRPATEEDLDDIARVFEASVSWLTARYRPDQAPLAVSPATRIEFYRHLLTTGTILLAEDPEPVGFSASVVRDGVWFLSQFWVVPERHGAGIGSALLQEALADGRGAGMFSVIASPSPAAQLLYLRSSMLPLWAQIDMRGVCPPAERVEGVEELTAADQAWVDELDRAVRGMARPEDHAFWRQSARGLALHRDGSPVGYIYGSSEGKIGPGAARDPSDIPLLLRLGALAIPNGGEATIAVPDANWVALRELTRLGFVPLGSNTFMASRALGDPSRYLSSGGALG